MYLLIALIHVTLLHSSGVESIVSKNHFQLFVKSVANVYHSNWRQDFLARNPSVKNRFKLTNAATNYDPSDFVYPMILTVGSCLVHRNLKVACNRQNTSLIYVDILNMQYEELPSDWAKENRATSRIACKYILQHARKRRVFNRSFIEKVSEIIHVEWMKRNAHWAQKELMVPYTTLPDVEKTKDRKAVIIACRIFNEQRLYQRFNTTPIHLTEYFVH